MTDTNNYKELWHRELGRADFALKELTMKDIVSYEKSEGFGRIWKKIKFGFSGKGLVNTETINSILKKFMIENDQYGCNEFRDECLENRNKLITQLAGKLIKDTIQGTKPSFITETISRVIIIHVEKNLDNEGNLNIQTCMANLNPFFFNPSQYAQFEDKKDNKRDEKINVFDNLPRLNPERYRAIILDSMDTIKFNRQVPENIDQKNIERMRKNMNNLSRAIFLLNHA